MDGLVKWVTYLKVSHLAQPGVHSSLLLIGSHSAARCTQPRTPPRQKTQQEEPPHQDSVPVQCHHHRDEDSSHEKEALAHTKYKSSSPVRTVASSKLIAEVKSKRILRRCLAERRCCRWVKTDHKSLDFITFKQIPRTATSGFAIEVVPPICSKD